MKFVVLLHQYNIIMLNGDFNAQANHGYETRLQRIATEREHNMLSIYLSEQGTIEQGSGKLHWTYGGLPQSTV